MVTPYYADDLVTIYHGDCREWMPEADVIVTDPPYGFGAYATDKAMADTLGMLRPLAVTLAVFGYPETLVAWCVDAGMKPDEWVTWWPTNKAAGRAPTVLARETEHVAIFGPTPGAARLMRPRSASAWGRKVTLQRGGDPDWAREGDVWRDASPSMLNQGDERLHPNEKPVPLLRKLIDLCSDGGVTVLDPFAGSGTTLRAAKDLGRHAIGIEIEERYCEIAATRCSQEVLGLVG